VLPSRSVSSEALVRAEAAPAPSPAHAPATVERIRRPWREALLRPVYALYTRRLRRRVREAEAPVHVAVILDGNRRWASGLGLTEPGAGHRHGADKVDELLDWCAAVRISEVTVWAVSNENMLRSEEELDSLLGIVEGKLEALAGRAGHGDTPMRIRVIGRVAELPARLQRTIDRVERRTAANRGLTLNIALGYSGRDELIDACRALVLALADAGVPATEIAKRVTRESLAARLYTAGAPDPDLIIRTSGEQRLSGFLPWQSTHSELYFAEAYWPAFRELDFLRAVRTFQLRTRRFGR
jgi:short-chain Z-isoprenyl diphosphate synthase